jgi:hypothetical protein
MAEKKEYMRHHSPVELFVQKSASPDSSTRWLLDATGRRVLGLKSGPDDVSRLAAGVHFVRGEGRVAGTEGQTLKIVIQK